MPPKSVTKVISRRPGRPKKKKAISLYTKTGISDKPIDSNNYIELKLIDVPSFKKTFSLLKQLGVTLVKFVFLNNSVTLIAFDRLQKNEIIIKLNCISIMHYHCSQDTDIILNCSDLILIASKLNATYTLIELNMNDENYVKLTLTNNIDISEIHELYVIEGDINTIVDENKINIHSNFKMPFKNFKKLICDSNKFGNTISIITSRNNLLFEYGKLCKCRVVMNKLKQFKYKTKLTDTEITTSIYVEYLKPIASGSLGDNIKLFVSDNILILRARLNSFGFNIYTKTI